MAISPTNSKGVLNVGTYTRQVDYGYHRNDDIKEDRMAIWQPLMFSRHSPFPEHRGNLSMNGVQGQNHMNTVRAHPPGSAITLYAAGRHRPNRLPALQAVSAPPQWPSLIRPVVSDSEVKVMLSIAAESVSVITTVSTPDTLNGTTLTPLFPATGRGTVASKVPLTPP